MSFRFDSKSHFSRKIKKPNHPVLIFNNNQVIQIHTKNTMFLDHKLNLREHLKYITYIVNNFIGPLLNL